MGRVLRERKPKSPCQGYEPSTNGKINLKKVGKAKAPSQSRSKTKKRPEEHCTSKPEPSHQVDTRATSRASINLAIKKEKNVKTNRSVKKNSSNECLPKLSDPPDHEERCRGKVEAGNEGSLMCVGAHCSIAGGVSNAVKEAKSIGAKAFGLFVRNGRTWKLNPLDENEAERFKTACREQDYPPDLILPHGSYLLNCGSSNPDTLKKSQDTLIYELQMCEKLGLTLYNFHPGSACGDGSVDQCIQTIAQSINLAHSETKYIKTVIENMSCQGQTVGGRFEELKAIIDKVADKSRVGVCLDTCHAFAAGFDLSTEIGYRKMMKDFEEKIGLQYLSAVHLNDSKGALGCHLDRHENIGKGHIGLSGFRRVMNDPRFYNIPMILETPPGNYGKEIQTLYKLTNP